MSEKIRDCIGTIANANYCIGVIAGVETVAKILRQRSGDARQSEQDMMAQLYRDAAQELDKLVKKKRAVYGSTHWIEKDEAWGILDVLLESSEEKPND